MRLIAQKVETMSLTVTPTDNLSLTTDRPGSWARDAMHLPRPVTLFVQQVTQESMKRGFSDAMRRYGVLLDHLDYIYPEGYAYFTEVPAPPEDIPARLGAAAQVFAQRLWRDDLRRWDEVVKPNSVKSQRALLAEDPTSMSLDQLLDYLDRCVENLRARVYDHHQFNAAALLPVGDFLAHASEWTGRDASQLLGLLRGSTPVSAGVSGERTEFLSLLRSDDEARALLFSDLPPGEILAGLQATPGRIGEAARSYVAWVGYRTTDGFDIAEPLVIEQPSVVIGALRRLVETGSRDVGAAVARATAETRNLVPDDKRAQFDELLAEAILVSRLRDERGFYTDTWAYGIARRAVLAAGGRLVAQERLHEDHHLVHAGYDEMRELLTEGTGPTADELAARARARDAGATVGTPSTLGDPPTPPPALDGLPPEAARVMVAIGTAISAIFVGSDVPNEPQVVRGLPASPGRYEGTARVLSGPSDLHRIRPGDVLVTASTSEAFNVALPMLGAIVTDAGGVLSHAAIVAREYGIPSVVGTREATTLIPDGARVVVDADAGVVMVA